MARVGELMVEGLARPHQDTHDPDEVMVAILGVMTPNYAQ
jgi:hypothetical protein